MNGITDPVTLVVADDHRVVRAGLRLLLESEPRFVVSAEAGSVAEAIAAVERHGPRVLVLDLNMGGESSLDAIPSLRRRAPETQIVVLTMQSDPAFARAALGAGALGYVLKDAADAELLAAVSLASEGRSSINPQLAARLSAKPSGNDRQPDGLSPRELEVLRLIALGHTSAEIAESLTLSVRTVESHRAHIHQKVQLHSRADLVAYAGDQGLLD